MPTILVVEDEPNVRKLVVVNLLQRGYQVLEAENGQKALKYLNDQLPALLVLDIKLPDLSGWDILDQLAKTPHITSNLPVLVMTATPLDPTSVLNQYPSIVDILIKPFNANRLISAIKDALKN
jgi:DNA-binding response OmpR family regulator